MGFLKFFFENLISDSESASNFELEGGFNWVQILI